MGGKSTHHSIVIVAEAAAPESVEQVNRWVPRSGFQKKGLMPDDVPSSASFLNQYTGSPGAAPEILKTICWLAMPSTMRNVVSL